MKTSILIPLLLMVGILSACNTSETQEIISEQGGFSIMSPLPLEESTQTVDTELGPIEAHFFLAEQDDRAYMVGYSDYPKEFVDQSDPQLMLDGARDGAIGNINGELVSELNILLDDQYPGREIVATASLGDQQGTLKEHIFIVDNRLYQVMVILPSAELPAEEIDEFINSFKLLAP